jgi:hypothetical protein
MSAHRSESAAGGKRGAEWLYLFNYSSVGDPCRAPPTATPA